MEHVPSAADGRPPYPHARNDCDLCRETDADFEIVEALVPPTRSGSRPRRFCQGCIGRWMVAQAISRPDGTSPGEPLTMTVTLLVPGGGTW